MQVWKVTRKAAQPQVPKTSRRKNGGPGNFTIMTALFKATRSKLPTVKSHNPLTFRQDNELKL